MSKGAQQAGSTTQTQTTAPYMYPYLGTALGQAGNLLQQGGPSPYPGQRVADFNPIQNQYFTGASNLGNNPNLASAGQFGTDLTSGNFSGPQANLAQIGTGSMNNPELQTMLGLQNDAIQNSISSQFGQAGRNVESSTPLQAQMMGNADSQLLSNAYNINQGNALAANQALGSQQLNAMGMAPGLNSANLANLNTMGQAGNQIQNQGQNLISASMDAFNQSQQRPYQNLGMFEQFLQGVQPGQQSQIPYFQNKGANTLGTALAGQQLYKGYQGKGANTPSPTQETAWQGAPYE